MLQPKIINPITTGDPGKYNTATKNPDGTVTLNEQVLFKQGQRALLDKAYVDKDMPYFGPYGSEYKGPDGRAVKGAGYFDYDTKSGLAKITDRFNGNKVRQIELMKKIRAMEENKGRDIYFDTDITEFQRPLNNKRKTREALDPTSPVKPIM